MIVLAIDIGSTWTKGASFQLESETAAVLSRSIRPTTTDNLSLGFFAVLSEISPDQFKADPLAALRSGEMQLQYSSSAKGGLAVAAIGLVPEITLELGKVAAQSAGAKLVQVFSYHLTHQDIAKLEAAPPDILLFAGGTDGGNTSYLLANAEAISHSSLDCDIIYAGNRSVTDEVQKLLAKKRLTIVENLLPNFNEPNPEPVRKAIRTIFLETIVKGKGLDQIMAATGAEPVPTPFAVLEYVRAIHQHVPGWSDFMLLDVGGATTDVYSAHQETPCPGTVLRGLPEPLIKRTVEGDLGMRVSAQSTCCVGEALLNNETSAQAELNLPNAAFAYADKLVKRPAHLPESEIEAAMDTLLAGICVGFAAERHAGRQAQVFTSDGEMLLQTGRNLSLVPKVIGAGGWLARAKTFSPQAWFAAHSLDARERRILLPNAFAYFRDAEGLFPLLANLARAYPKEAATAGISWLCQ